MSFWGRLGTVFSRVSEAVAAVLCEKRRVLVVGSGCFRAGGGLIGAAVRVRVIGCAVLALAFGVASTQPAIASGWAVQSTPALAVSLDALSAVSCTAAMACTAVGSVMISLTSRCSGESCACFSLLSWSSIDSAGSGLAAACAR